MRLNLHFHVLVLDGVYSGSSGEAVFHRVAAPSDEEQADQAIDVKVPGFFWARFRATDRVVAEVHPQSNLLWVRMDRAFLYIETAANWSHGCQRVEEPITMDKAGVTDGWSSAQRKNLIDWIGVLQAAKLGAEKFGPGRVNRKKAQKIEDAAEQFVYEEIKRFTAAR